jgi:hypothetical protein
MKKLLFALVLLSSQAFAQNVEAISKSLRIEWSEFRMMVETLEADGDIGGYMEFKEFGEMTLLWRTSDNPSDNEVIRFYMDRPGIKSFAVTYHRSHHIVDGKTVIRRFVGTEPAGWINHTIDFVTGEYLGHQGYFPYDLKESELNMMRDWGITLYKD